MSSPDTTPGLRALVCGGREFSARSLLWRVMDEAHATDPIGVLIQGGAPGADHLAAMWAVEHGITVETFLADWSVGRSAGPIRNQRMIDEGRPDMAFAFPGSRGTADMVRRLKDAAIPVFEVPRNYGVQDVA